MRSSTWSGLVCLALWIAGEREWKALSVLLAYLFPLFFLIEGGRSQMSVMMTRRKDNG